jgi:RNase P subunit RPR2
MESLKFICPTTGHVIDSGVETDAKTLRTIAAEKLQMRCPRCGGIHRFPIKEGFVADAA